MRTIFPFIILGSAGEVYVGPRWCGEKFNFLGTSDQQNADNDRICAPRSEFSIDLKWQGRREWGHIGIHLSLLAVRCKSAKLPPSSLVLFL
jgi:hypothetical protein